MKKNILKLIAIFLIGMAGGIFADQIFWPYFVEKPLFSQYRLEQSPVYVNETREVIVRENTALTSAIEKAEKSVVGVGNQGSGLIVTSDGLIVTLAELALRNSVQVYLGGDEPVEAQVLKRDSENNLALLKIKSGNLPTVGFAAVDKLKIGERVFLLGFLNGLEGLRTAANEGAVRIINDKTIITNIQEEKKMKGSVLFNIGGEALGINEIGADGKVSSISIKVVKELIGF